MNANMSRLLTSLQTEDSNGKISSKVKLIDIEKKLPQEKRSLEHRLYADTYNDLNRIVHENKEY